MKPASTALQNLLASREFQACGLYQFALVTGGSLYYASGDVDIKVGSQFYTAGGVTGPFFDTSNNRAKAHWKVGVEVDTLVFDVLPKDALVQGVPLLSAVRQGVFDGAEMTYSRAYWPRQAYQTPVSPAGTVQMFVGRVAEVDAGRSLATFSVNSHLELLNQNLPRNLFQPGCVNTLYDAGCTVNRAAYAVNGTCSGSQTRSQIQAVLPQDSGYFDLGTITFAGGVNGGISRTVKYWQNTGSPGSFQLIAPFPNAPANGDTFTVLPGCDKTQDTCTNKFANLMNFRAFPFIPSVETGV